jgi:hypothetical protein
VKLDTLQTARGAATVRPRLPACSLAGGVFVLALAFALEGGRGFPARRAGGDAEIGGDRLLCHSLGEQLRRPLLFSGSLLSAVALVGELLLGPRPHRLAAPARRDAALAVGGLGGGAGAGGSLERGALTEPLAHLGGGQPIPAAADAPAGEAAVQLLGDRVGVAPLGVGARARGRSIPATRRSEAGLRPRRGRGGDGLLAREGDNPLGDLGPPIVELAVE